MPEDIDEVLPADARDAGEYVRETWLHMRVLENADTDAGGGYRIDPSDYVPVELEKDGVTQLVFAKA
jgi:hypothetical protein